MKVLRLQAEQLMETMRAEEARARALPAGSDSAVGVTWKYSRDAAEQIASELSHLPGPALDHWYAAGVALLAMAQATANVSHVAGYGSCPHQRASALQANITAATAYLLIERSGGLR